MYWRGGVSMKMRRVFGFTMVIIMMVSLCGVQMIPEKQLITTKVTEVSAKTTPVERYGQLSVSGTSLVGENGKKFMMKGVSTHGLSWYPQYVDKKGFQNLRDKWKVNTIRLALYTEEYAGYCSGGDKKKLEELVTNGVKMATDLGMYVIVDWHILSDGNPNTHVKEAKAFFKKMSKKFKKNKNVIYEICNEPNGGTTWKDIKKYAQKVIPVIRNNSPKAIIVVGTPTWSQDVDIAAKSPIKKYKNLVYSLHFYSGTHKAELRKKAKEALEAKLPILVTEFGITDASGNGNVNKKEANTWIKFLRKNKVGFCIWNLSNKDESCALIQANCNKTNGWSAKNLTVQGKWYKKT